MTNEPDWERTEARVFAHVHYEVLTLALVHYDHMRDSRWPEHDARQSAQAYMRGRVPELDDTGAAVILADALARRAEEKLKGA